MKKETNIINTFTETNLSVFLLGIVLISFFFTSNLSRFTQKEKPTNVLGSFIYSKTFNPEIFTNENLSVSKSDGDIGASALKVIIKSRNNEEGSKIMTIYNDLKYHVKINIVLDIKKFDDKANYYLMLNDEEKLIKDSFKAEQYNYIVELEPGAETVISVKVKGLDSIDTIFNVYFSEI